MKILAVNAGSSSLKVQLIEMPEEVVIAKATVERIGSQDAIVTVKYGLDKGENNVWKDEHYPILSHSDAVKAITDKFADFNVISSPEEIKGCAHRIVQGGEYFSKTEIVTEDVSKKVLELAELAPHHNKAEHAGYEAFKSFFPNAVHTMVFDTAYHQTIPAARYIFPLPYKYYTQYKIRRYGAHGTSHKYIASVVNKYYGKDVKTISCHLGSGASLCAIENGKSVDTSMGFTPLGGIAMGTRCGDIDPSTLFYIMNKENLTPDQMNHICNFESGIRGMSVIHDDMRLIEKAAKEGEEQAILAHAVYCNRVAQFIGSYFVELGGADCIVFTAGVGENSSFTRDGIMKIVAPALGINFDFGEANKEPICDGLGFKLSLPGSKLDVLVIPTNEELMMCRDTYQIVKGLNK